MMNKFSQLAVIGAMLALSCNDKPATQQDAAAEKFQTGTFGYDLDFLRGYDSVIVLQTDGGKAQVVVSAKYQAKVFTSTADGYGGRSFGWIHYKAFSGPVDAHMNGYGGENRIWLGPEGGKFSLFFEKGAKMAFDNWKTPGAIDTATWKVVSYDEGSARLQKDMQLVNYAGTPLSISVTRDISILSRQAVDSVLKLGGDTSIKVVGYRTVNTMTNTGTAAWTEQSGGPCIWILDMFNPSPATVIVVPYAAAAGTAAAGKAGDAVTAGSSVKGKAGDAVTAASSVKGKAGDSATAGAAANKKVATTDYFGEIPADRIKFDQSTLFFKADGKSRGKLGIHPAFAKPVAGSYDAQNKVLTLTLFDVDPAGKYLNQEWNTAKPPFSGDAVNAYNDGPLADGSQMGPFYEIESVSPAALLDAGKSITHHHAVFHLTGDEKALDRVSQAWLGVSLENIKKAF